MYEFKYHRPATVRQAANLLVKNEDAKLIAGGHTLVPVMKQRLASPPHLVDLSHVEGLDAIEIKGRALVIGVGATITLYVCSCLLMYHWRLPSSLFVASRLSIVLTCSDSNLMRSTQPAAPWTPGSGSCS